jgi:hypothetical protein
MWALLVACVYGPGNGLGGQSGSEGDLAPPGCEEVSREAVDLDALPDGFSSTPQQELDATTGDWVGWCDTDTTDAGVLTDGAMSLTRDDSAVDLVIEQLAGYTDEDGNTVDPRPDEQQCPTHYEMGMHVTLAGDEGGLDEAFDVTLVAAKAGYLQFDAEIPVADLGGTDRPSWPPNAWEDQVLRLHLDRDIEDQTYLIIDGTWWGWTEDTAAHEVQESSETCCGFALHRP